MIPLFILNLVARIPTPFRKVAKTVGIILAIALGMALIYGAIVWYWNKQVNEAVAVYTNSVSAETLNTAGWAEARANGNMIDQVRKDTINDEELKDEAAKGDDSSVGPGTRAVLQRMYDQQKAGTR